jgi:hypothetical protein
MTNNTDILEKINELNPGEIGQVDKYGFCVFRTLQAKQFILFVPLFQFVLIAIFVANNTGRLDERTIVYESLLACVL